MCYLIFRLNLLLETLPKAAQQEQLSMLQVAFELCSTCCQGNYTGTFTFDFAQNHNSKVFENWKSSFVFVENISKGRTIVFMTSKLVFMFIRRLKFQPRLTSIKMPCVALVLNTGAHNICIPIIVYCKCFKTNGFFSSKYKLNSFSCLPQRYFVSAGSNVR